MGSGLMLLSGCEFQGMSLPLAGLWVPSLKQGVGSSDQKLLTSTTRQICTQPVYASFLPARRDHEFSSGHTGNPVV